MNKHANIPVFIPHLGCPNQCVFCNQRTISGVSEFDISSLNGIIDSALMTISPDTETEIAFFGGSFTGIERSLMISLLEIANTYISAGKASAIRCSTRPDYIDSEIIEILKKYNVSTVELGLQSADDSVLKAVKRGHTFADEVHACKMITDAGINLVGQMMIGLPGSTPKSESETADFIIASGAKAARIYPTVVFRDTELCEMAQSGIYKPLEIEDAITRTANVYTKFLDAGVSVIRVGLCSSENLSSSDTYFSGPNHPALGELVENEVYYKLMCKEFLRFKTNALIGKTPIVKVPGGELSKVIGQKKKNKIRLVDKFLLSDIKFHTDSKLLRYQVDVNI